MALPANLDITTNAFGPALGKLVEKTVTHWYDSQTPPIPPDRRVKMDGFRPNLIQDDHVYKVRPLHGAGATPPFLHNGAVPNVYALLSPVSERPKTFYLGRRDYDPVCMGYQLTAVPAGADNLDLRCLGDKNDPDAGKFDGGFKLDTAIRGNRNTGHEFNDGSRGNASLAGSSLPTNDGPWWSF